MCTERIKSIEKELRKELEDGIITPWEMVTILNAYRATDIDIEVSLTLMEVRYYDDVPWRLDYSIYHQNSIVAAGKLHVQQPLEASRLMSAIVESILK